MGPQPAQTKAVARIFVRGYSPSPSLLIPPLLTPLLPSSPFPSPSRGSPPPLPARGLGSAVSSPSGFRGRAPAANAFFGHFCGSETYLVAAISPLGACLCASS